MCWLTIAFMVVGEQIKKENDQRFCGKVTQLIKVGEKPMRYKVLASILGEQKDTITTAEDTPFIGQEICFNY